MITRQVAAAGRLTRARTQLLLNQPFFGTLAVRLKLEPRLEFPTMATDGRRIAYSPAFVESLTPAELEGTLAHEVLHCALAHHCRRGDRDPRTWNEACDYAINPLLIQNGFTLPAGALIDAAFANLGAEDIYARLTARRAPEAGRNDDGSSRPDNEPSGAGASTPHVPTQGVPEERAQTARAGGFGEVLDAVGEDAAPASQAEKSRQQQEWAIASDQALQCAKTCGHLPGGVERHLNAARESKRDWRAILRDFISATDPSDYGWLPPNRRFAASGLYLPSVVRAGIGEIVIAVDTSGSIGSAELEQFAGEINAIAAEVRPERIHVVYSDAAVQGAEHFESGDELVLHPRGGGGTDFQPVFEWVDEQALQPKCLIYLTDLCCSSYPEVPDYPVLWVTDSKRTAPFGETLQISE